MHVPPANVKIITQTPFGAVCVVWASRDDAPVIERIVLSSPGLSAVDRLSAGRPGLRAASCALIDHVATAIGRFLAGEAIEFSLDIVDLDRCSEFQRRVLRAEHGVPRGRVSTYRLIAEHLGNPRGARAVGTALANNPFPLIVPCHRVVRSDRCIGGYRGGVGMKRELLAREGVSFDDADRVVCERFHYG